MEFNKNLIDVQNIFFEGIKVDKNIIKVGDSKFVKVFINDIIDIDLERD